MWNLLSYYNKDTIILLLVILVVILIVILVVILVVILFFTFRYSSDVHKDFVHGLSWQPDSSSFLTCSWDGSVYSHSFNESMIPPPPPPPLMESTDIDWLADETLLPKEEDLNEEMVLEDDDDNRYPPVKQAIMETTVASGNGVSSSPVTLQTNDSR